MRRSSRLAEKRERRQQESATQTIKRSRVEHRSVRERAVVLLESVGNAAVDAVQSIEQVVPDAVAESLADTPTPSATPVQAPLPSAQPTRSAPVLLSQEHIIQRIASKYPPEQLLLFRAQMIGHMLTTSDRALHHRLFTGIARLDGALHLQGVWNTFQVTTQAAAQLRTT
jgi:hypothetical protein